MNLRNGPGKAPSDRDRDRGGGGRYRYGDGQRDRGPPSGLRRPVGLGHTAGVASAPAEKPRIGNRELSLENLARKDFLGVLNKLSAANQATLIANFAKVIRPDFADLYVKLFWEGFLRSSDYQPVQINLLTLFAEHFPVQPRINALLSEYRTERLWMPAEGVLPPPTAAPALRATSSHRSPAFSAPPQRSSRLVVCCGMRATSTPQPDSCCRG